MPSKPLQPIPLAFFASVVLGSTPIIADTETNVTDAQLDTVSVSPRYWQENNQTTPFVVSSQLHNPQDSSIWSDLDALDGQFANVRLENSSVQQRLVIRGNSAVNTGLQDPVAVIVDGVALPLGMNQLPALFNFSQLQLLKGPQGSLYGRNSEAGALILSSPVLSDSLRGWANLSTIQIDGYTQQSRHKTSVGASSKLTANSRFGLAALIERGGSGYYNEFNNSEKGGDIDQKSLAASADVDVSQDTQIRLRSRIDRSDNGMARMRYDTGMFKTNAYQTNYNRDADDQQDTDLHSLVITQQFTRGTLTAISGYNRYQRNFIMDLDAATLPTPASQLDQNNRNLSQEVRWNSTSDTNQPRWLAGLYLFDENSDINFISGVPSNNRTTDIQQSGHALFADVELPLDQALTINMGGRVEQLKQSGKQTRRILQGPAQLTSQYRDSDNTSEFLPRLGLSYQWYDHLLFSNLSQGYLPGGYNYNQASNPQNFSYKPEYSDHFETGFKSQWQPQTNSIISVFYTRGRDKQIAELQPGGVQRINNAAKTLAYGIEFSLRHRFINGWKVSGELGLQKTKAVKYDAVLFSNNQLKNIDLSGQQLPYAAPFSAALELQYDNGSGWFSRSQIQASGGIYFDSANTVRQKAYQILNSEIGYEFHHFRLSVAARNLFNQHYLTRALITPNGRLVEDGQAREVSINLSAFW